MRRIYHHYEKWEDWRDGLYSTAPDTNQAVVRRAARLLASPDFLKTMMQAAVRGYPHAAEVNLSNRGRNRQAWLGQAACCYCCGATEDMTKSAWHHLSLAEQSAANAVADAIIQEWELSYAQA